MPSHQFRIILILAATSLVAAYIGGAVDWLRDWYDPNPTGKPNILLIMVDDMGFNDLAINNGNTDIDTPRLDQFARDGVRFTRHYASMVCSPARASILTGLVPERIFPVGKGVSPEIVTLPETLKKEGYTTWHIGKWHIGDVQREAMPDRQGFDHWFGFRNQYFLGGTHQKGELQPGFPTYLDPWLDSDTEPGRHYQGHLESILTTKAIQVISDLNNAGAPWFVNLWFFAPHQPWTPANEFAKNYPADPAGRYRALVNQLDTNIGQILDHLESIGALKNTIVVVVSDNGGVVAKNNAPFYGTKSWLFEGSLRTPLIIRFPDDSINRQVFSEIISIADIYPTLLAAIGVAVPDDLDGKSFYRTLQHLEPAPQKDLYWEVEGISSYGGLSADGRWRYYKQPAGFLGGAEFLYDLDLDPTGSHVVAPEQPAQLAQMRENYQAWFKDIHTVKTVYTPGQNGSGTLTGMSFLRTPGHGPYTFGIGVPDGYSGSIVAQQGVWKMSQSGNRVTAQFGSTILSGDIEEASTSSCHSIVVVGNFTRRASTNSKDRITLALYLDGVMVQQTKVDAILDVPDILAETIIGDPDRTGSSQALSPPVILNTVLSASSPWTLDSFSQELCNTP
jgi:arylsulfatase A-like enzyme